MSEDEESDHFFDETQINYDALITGSMHWLVRRVLERVSRKGLPGEHHLYIGFDTRMPRVVLSKALRKRHLKEMTIVLQHRFDNLEVDAEGFSVSLSFSGVLERLGVPYEALTHFYDPSCGFVLQLEQQDDQDTDSEDGEEGEVVSLEQFRKGQPDKQ